MPSRGELIGVALAGGQSRRMGRDKALLPLPEVGLGSFDTEGAVISERAGGDRGTPGDLVTWTVRRLCEVCDEVAVADRGRRLVPDHPSISDGSGKGPIAGILGAAREYPGRRLLVLACDLPQVPVAFLHHLTTFEADWVVPISESGRLEPLAAIYDPSAIEKLDGMARRGLWAVRALEGESELRIRRIDVGDWSQESSGKIFSNVNTPEDYDQLAAVRQNRLRQGSTSR